MGFAERLRLQKEIAQLEREMESVDDMYCELMFDEAPYYNDIEDIADLLEFA